MSDIVIPYCHRFARWEELKYALRAWERFYGAEEVVLIGDLPEWCTGVTFLPWKRNDKAKHSNFSDTSGKLKYYIESRIAKENFIWTYDDIYPIRFVDEEDLLRPWAVQRFPEGCDQGNERGHVDLILRTMQLFESPCNYETHMPRLYNRTPMRMLFEIYREEIQSGLQVSSLYFNHWLFEPVLMEKDYPRVCFHGRDNKGSFSSDDGQWIEQNSSRALFMNHNNSGLTVKLRQFLERLFPDKSHFEK